MKKLTIFAVVSTVSLFLFVNIAEAANNWEVRRLKNGTCGVAKMKQGIKPGSNHIAGPYATKKRANKELKKLKSGPRCKRF